MKAHDLARRLLAGPDNPTVVPTYDDHDREQHVEVTDSGPLPEKDRCWYDTDSAARDDPAVEIRTAGD